MATRHAYRRAYCTTLCPRRRNPETDCAYCQSLDNADQFWELLSPANLWKALQLRRRQPKSKTPQSWTTKAYRDLTGPYGYRVVVPVIMTILGAYVGLYAIMEARHERRQNRAAFERSAFTDLVTSNNRGSFVAAMKHFGLVQMMEVPPEPHILAPWDWRTRPNQPNRKPLWSWALHFFPLCTPELCGIPEDKEDSSSPSYRIDLRWANLGWADLWEANLTWADLWGADLTGANLKGTESQRG